MKAGALIPHGSDYTTTSYLVNLIFLITLRVLFQNSAALSLRITRA